MKFTEEELLQIEAQVKSIREQVQRVLFEPQYPGRCLVLGERLHIWKRLFEYQKMSDVELFNEVVADAVIIGDRLYVDLETESVAWEFDSDVERASFLLDWRVKQLRKRLDALRNTADVIDRFKLLPRVWDEDSFVWARLYQLQMMSDCELRDLIEADSVILYYDWTKPLKL